MNLFEGIIDETQFMGGVYAISTVEFPAMESEFIQLAQSEIITLKSVNDQKRILMGAVLIPNKPVPRKDENDKTFHIYFSKETVRRAMELFFMRGHQSDVTFEHTHPIKGISFSESWIVEDKEKDKSAFYDFNVPIGTWMASAKVEDEKLWNELKQSGVKGWSIEGLFVPKPVKKMSMSDDEKINKIKSLLKI